jgi:RNA polymerase sigma factor (sigma-70 family)
MKKTPDHKRIHKKDIAFPSTIWTDIRKWENASERERRESLHRFYQRYKIPLLGFLKYNGCSNEEVDDVLHDFIVEQIQGKIFIKADPERGRFRNLLLSSLKNFLISRRRKESAATRKPAKGFSFLDEELSDGVCLKDLIEDRMTPEEIYERAWFLALLSNVLERMRNEYRLKNQGVHLVLFERRVIQPILHGAAKRPLQELAQELGLSPSEASNYIVTAKRAYQRHLREEISGYVSSEKEVAEEINDLLYFLQNLQNRNMPS